MRAHPALGGIGTASLWVFSPFHVLRDFYVTNCSIITVHASAGVATV